MLKYFMLILNIRSKVFLRFTANADAATSLVLRNSLLNWMENQCSSVLDGEDLPWAMIIENILTMTDHEKLDSNTAGGWRTSVSHNLEVLMKRKGAFRRFLFRARGVDGCVAQGR